MRDLAQLPRGEAGDRGGRQQHQMRHARQDAEQAEDAGNRRPGARRAELGADLAGEILARGDASDDRGGGDREHE
jgi:hypothetical protein